MNQSRFQDDVHNEIGKGRKEHCEETRDVSGLLTGRNKGREGPEIKAWKVTTKGKTREEWCARGLRGLSHLSMA